MAAFIVHEFATALTTQKKRQANRTALAEFVGNVMGAVAPEQDSWLLGPSYVAAARWSKLPLYIGHLTTSGSQQRLVDRSGTRPLLVQPRQSDTLLGDRNRAKHSHASAATRQW